jgi:hypothetical protein
MKTRKTTISKDGLRAGRDGVVTHSTATFRPIGVAVTLYACIRDVPGSNLGPVIGYD